MSHQGELDICASSSSDRSKGNWFAKEIQSKVLQTTPENEALLQEALAQNLNVGGYNVALHAWQLNMLLILRH